MYRLKVAAPATLLVAVLATGPAMAQAPGPAVAPQTTAAPYSQPFSPVGGNGTPSYYLQGKSVTFEHFQAAKLVTEALALMRNNQNEEAAEKLRQAIVLAPDMAEPHHNLGLVLAKLGDVPHAIEQLNLAIKYKPDLESSWLTLGGIHQSVGHIDQAVDIYQNFLKMFPKHPMHDKIARLVEGLQTEKKGIQSARQEDAILSGSGGQGHGAQGVLQVPGQPVNADDDYLANVTRKGIIHWPTTRLPIKVYVFPAEDAQGNPLVSGYKHEFKDVLARAFSDWAAASNGLLKFEFVPEKRLSTLVVRWVDDPSPANLQNPAEAGEAQVFTDAEGIASGRITLLTKSISPVLPLTANRLRVICLHEIGHALGLAGHTTNPEDIMFYSVSFKDEWRELAGRDSRTIQRLYSSK